MSNNSELDLIVYKYLEERGLKGAAKQLAKEGNVSTSTVPSDNLKSIFSQYVGTKKAAATTNGKNKHESSSSSSSDSDSDSEDEKPLAKATPVAKSAPAAKKPSSSSSSSESESEDEKPSKMEVDPPKKAPTSAAKVPAKKQQSSSSDSDSSSEDEKPTKAAPAKVTPAKVAAKKAESSSSSSSSSESDSESEDEVPVKKQPVKATPPAAAAKRKAESSSSGSESDSESSSSSESEEEAKPASKKLKVDTTKAVKTATTPAKSSASTPVTPSGDHKVYVKGLPWKASEEEVRDFFKDCGSIASVEIPMAEDGRSTGTAYVRFADRKGLEAALAKDEQIWPGTERWLKIQEGFDKPDRRTSGPTGVRPDGCDTVFVGNLPWDVEEDQLRTLFAECGEVVSVRFATAEDGSFKGFGHVQFSDGSSTDEAVKLAGSDVNGRAIRVDYAPPRVRDSLGGGGRGGGRGGRDSTPRGRGGDNGRGRGGRGGRGGSATPTSASKNKGAIATSSGKKTSFGDEE